MREKTLSGVSAPKILLYVDAHGFDDLAKVLSEITSSLSYAQLVINIEGAGG